MKVVHHEGETMTAVMERGSDDLAELCPFCGCSDIELTHTWTAHYWMECTGCGAEVSDPKSGGNHRNPKAHIASAKRALKAWNRRWFK